MIYRVSVVLLILIFAGTCFAQGENKPEQVITELKPLYRQTTIVTDGEANAVIVIPDSDEYGELARQVQETVKDASGADLPVATDDSIDMDNPPQHLIIIGNMDTNAAAQWLYWRRYVACDLDYPGPDGYVVRTACDPWGTGTNAIMLGGSDMQGIRSAVETFETHVTPGNTLTLPMLMDIHIRNIETIDEAALQKEWDYYREEIIEAGGLWYQVENRIFRLAYDYYLTGIEEYAQMYAAVLPRWFEEYYRFTPHRQLTTPKYQMPDMFLAFDLVEESPAISEELRLEMTNLFLDYAIRMGQGGRVHNWQPGEMRLTGHIPLLSVLYGYQYFTKYYPDQPMELLQQGMDNVRTAMESYTNSVGFMSETGYLCYHPELLLYYSQASGDRTWYETGNALKWEHYHTLVTDNLGAALGKWTPTHLMAARYYEDGRWLWLSNFQRHNDDYTTGVTNGKLVGPRWLGRPDLDPVIPDGLTGLEVFGMTEKWHSELQRQRGELGVEASKAFHQAAMRTSFDRNAQYMRIPGVNVGFHYGTPANAVERLTDRGRSWLVNGRWGMSLPKYYNTMLVVKDGQTYTDLPYLCRLHTATDLPQTGFFQSELPGYTGSDWMRSVVWNKQRYWLIFDSVTAREDAEYTCLCQWRVGRNSQPLLEDAKALVEGGGQHLVIETPESPSMAVLPEGPLNAPPSSYMYRQGITRSLAAGDSADFCNLLWVKGGSAVIDGWRRWQSSAQTAFPTTENPHTGDMALQLNNTGEGWQCLNQKLDLAPGETYRATGWARTNGKLGAVIQIRDEAADNVMIGEIRTDAEEWTKLELEFEAPAEGQNPQIWLLHHHYNAPEGVAWFDDISVVAADGPEDNLVTNGGFESSGDAWRVSAEYSVRGLDDGCVIVSDGEEYWISGASGDGEARQFNPAESVSVTARAFQIGGGTVDLAAATALNCGDLAFTSDTPVDLSLDLTSGEGLVRAEAASAVSLKGIGTISAQKLEMTSDTSMKVASGEWAFGFETDLNQPVANAAAIWQAARKPGAQQQREYPGEAMQTIWELSEEAETQVNTVDAADIDNDGSVEVVAGLQDGTTIAIDDDGTEIFRHTADGPINDVCCADLAGETPVLLVASDDYTLYALDPAGETIWEFSSEGRDITTKLAGELGTGRHVSSEGEFITIEIDDIDGDGTPEILAGAKAFKHGNRHVYGTLWVLSADGELLWHVFNFGGTVDTIDAADIDGDGEKEITFGTGGGTYGRRAYLVQPGGELIAQFSGPYGEKRAAFGQLQEGAGPAVVRLERANGSVDVYAASEEAELLWTYPTSGLTSVGPFVRDFDGDGLDEICVAGASGDVYMLGGGEEHLVWRTNLGQPVACMDVAEVEGNPVIALGTYSGHLFTVNASGEITAHAHLLSGITSLTVTQTGAITAGLENGTVAMVR